MNLILFIGLFFAATSILGVIIEKIRVPWMFAAMFIGFGLAVHPVSLSADSLSHLQLLSDIGLYMLLFMIGFDLNAGEIMKLKGFIIKMTFSVEFLEALMVGTLIHFVVHINWPLALLVALTFATVGEAILLPILDEFKLTKTKLGQAILGVAVFDDVIELLVITLVVGVAPYLAHISGPSLDALEVLKLFGFLAIFTAMLIASRNLGKLYFLDTMKVSEVLPIILTALFVVVGLVATFTPELDVLAAVLAGILARNVIPEDIFEKIESELKIIGYGLFTPFFLLSVGMEIDTKSVGSYIWIAILILVVANIAKIFASTVVGRKRFSLRQNVMMGVALGVRFSTGIVMLKIMLDKGIIGIEIFSALIAASILFKLFVPLLLTYLTKIWSKDLVEA